MTIREAMNDLVAGLGRDADPREVLSEHGFGDLPPEALSSALVHFAERTSLEVADALAPIVTRLSPVPFGEGDLPPAEGAEAILAEGGDVFDLLAEVEPADISYADPSEFDLDEAAGPAAGGDQGDPGQGESDDTFGLGDETDLDEPHTSAFDEDLDELEPVAVGMADDQADLHDPVGQDVAADDLDELLSVDLDEPTIDDDPSDFDLD